ncbi:hypothetical protein M3J09_013860 [Ascochyta lentis]
MNVKRTRTREFWLSVHCYKCMTTFATRTVHRRHAANSRRPTVAVSFPYDVDQPCSNLITPCTSARLRSQSTQTAFSCNKADAKLHLRPGRVACCPTQGYRHRGLTPLLQPRSRLLRVG